MHDEPLDELADGAATLCAALQKLIATRTAQREFVTKYSYVHGSDEIEQCWRWLSRPVLTLLAQCTDHLVEGNPQPMFKLSEWLDESPDLDIGYSLLADTGVWCLSEHLKSSTDIYEQAADISNSKDRRKIRNFMETIQRAQEVASIRAVDGAMPDPVNVIAPRTLDYSLEAILPQAVRNYEVSERRVHMADLDERYQQVLNQRYKNKPVF